MPRRAPGKAVARVRLLALLAAGWLVVAGCGGEPKDHAARGVIEKVDPARREITIDHQDIPGFMKAMTMTFQAAESVPLEKLTPGTEVDFRVRLEGRRYVVTEVKPRR